MESSRREALKLAGVAGAAGALSLVLGTKATAMEGGDSNALSARWQQRLSETVVEDSTNALAKLVRAPEAATPADWAVAAFAAKSLFNHLGETGYTASVERDIAKGSVLRIDDAAWASIQQSVDQVVGVGSSGAFGRIPDEQREAAMSFIGERGVQGLLDESVTLLEAAATRAQQRALGGRPIESLRDDCQYLTMIVDAINLIAGLNAAGCAFGCAPCCLIALAFGLVGLAMQLFIDTHIC